MTRDELIQKIDAAKREMEHAGPIHRRDLAKHIRRMEYKQTGLESFGFGKGSSIFLTGRHRSRILPLDFSRG